MKSLWKYLCALCSSGKQYYVKGIRIGEKIATKSPLIDGQNLAKSFSGRKKGILLQDMYVFQPKRELFLISISQNSLLFSKRITICKKHNGVVDFSKYNHP